MKTILGPGQSRSRPRSRSRAHHATTTIPANTGPATPIARVVSPVRAAVRTAVVVRIAVIWYRRRAQGEAADDGAGHPPTASTAAAAPTHIGCRAKRRRPDCGVAGHNRSGLQLAGRTNSERDEAQRYRTFHPAHVSLLQPSHPPAEPRTGTVDHNA